MPVTIEQTDPTGGPINAIKLVIDENPAPVAAEIRFGPAMMPLKFETRVRVNQYSNIRVIADTPNGSYMTGRFVKASGGCSAPATKDSAAALTGMGDMRLKLFDLPVPDQTSRREAQIMIRHPNYSGLQRDQVTQLFIGAHFINELEVRQGDELLFSLEGGISISENPVFPLQLHRQWLARLHGACRRHRGERLRPGSAETATGLTLQTSDPQKQSISASACARLSSATMVCDTTAVLYIASCSPLPCCSASTVSASTYFS